MHTLYYCLCLLINVRKFSSLLRSLWFLLTFNHFLNIPFYFEEYSNKMSRAQSMDIDFYKQHGFNKKVVGIGFICFCNEESDSNFYGSVTIVPQTALWEIVFSASIRRSANIWCRVTNHGNERILLSKAQRRNPQQIEVYILLKCGKTWDLNSHSVWHGCITFCYNIAAVV